MNKFLIAAVLAAGAMSPAPNPGAVVNGRSSFSENEDRDRNSPSDGAPSGETRRPQCRQTGNRSGLASRTRLQARPARWIRVQDGGSDIVRA